MARYIDADELKKKFGQIGCVADDLYGMGINRGLERAETAVDMMPATDVAPKSEVAREIFKEMQSCLVMRHWHGHDILSFEFDAVKYAELEKKYTGEQT